ncbi:TetR family transcriptional regulator [Raineyella sp. LH-20]|uniref:TetR family transcriptional regulator n=1 Tax=Raineyella sp. LH-20 TaxID=3081204 RepID=UPI0029535F84|nr:TetR family transcriptional regulator [Raineyella sp. LH-20]WOP20158.1 TetR family transcriptional regulator [Raineyella sp. LH-20]
MATTPDRDETCGLRERKKRESHRALRIAALELVAERGLSDVRVEDIAHRAGVSPRTFFNYFTSKEQALVDPTPHHGADLRARILQAPPGPEVRDVLLTVLIDHALELASDRTTWRLVKEVTSRHPELLPLAMGSSREISRVLRSAVAERLGTDPELDPYPTILVEASVATLRAAAAHFLHARTGAAGPAALTADDTADIRATLEAAAASLRAGFPTPATATAAS